MFDKIKKGMKVIIFVGIVISISILGSSLVDLIISIILGVVINISISFMEVHKIRKEALNDSKNKYMKQFELADSFVESVQIAKDKK